MIVRQTGDALQLITQPDHAALAGAIMEHSVGLAGHPRRSSILLAVAEHDNGWTEPDAAPPIDPATGVPLDFISAPIEIRQGVWPRGVARLANDPWTAALVAQHAIAIFDRYRGDAAWARFFADMEMMRRTMLETSGLSFDELVADYRFLGLGDVISLTFCNGWTDVQRFQDWSVQLSGSQVVVSPDAFGGASIPIAVDANEIPRRRYRDEAELREARTASLFATVRGVVVGGSSQATSWSP